MQYKYIVNRSCGQGSLYDYSSSSVLIYSSQVRLSIETRKETWALADFGVFDDIPGKQKVSHKYRYFMYKKHSDESGMYRGQEGPHQHIQKVLEQDMSEVICHENSAMYFSLPDHTLDWTGGEKDTATLMMVAAIYRQV